MKNFSKAAVTSSIIFFCFLLAAIAFGQEKRAEDQQTLRLNATLIQVPAVVTDRNGRFIADLSQTEFAVFEDGKRQELSHFAAVKQPFTAVLLLDTSNSAEDRLQVIQNMALAFARETRAGDRLSVVSFDNEVRQLTDFTSDYKEIEKSVRGAESGFGKLLYEALTKSLDLLSNVEGRRAVILFSDGVDMRSIEATAESTIEKAEEVGAVIYFVRFETRWWQEAIARKQKAEQKQSNLPFEIDGRIPLPPEFGGPEAPGAPPRPRIEIGQPRSPQVTIIDGDQRRTIQTEAPDEITRNLDKLYGEADQQMQLLTSRTGGRIFYAETYETTRSAFASIADELRNQYVVGYYPANERRDGKFHKLKVEVSRKGAQVRARTGYRAPKASEN
jgi:VWFA-related protein